MGYSALAMAQLNPQFARLRPSYIFSQIEERKEQLQAHLLGRPLLNFGIGDVALPLAPHIGEAIQEATREMTTSAGLRGYGPSTGYPFLKEAIWKHELQGLPLTPDEIFISDGINTDGVNLLDLFAPTDTVALTNPTYPAY